MIKLNLLATRELKKKETMQQQFLLGAFFLILTIAAIGYFHMNINKQIDEAIEEKMRVDKEVADLKKEIGDLEKFKSMVDDLQKKKDTINNLEIERNGPVRVFAAMTEAIPPEVWIIDFTQNGMSLTINGYAVDNETLATFMRSLTKSNYFNNIKLAKSEKSEYEGHTVNRFSLTMAIVYYSPETPEATE
ncbi:MAG: PilN domain-containing protein [Deltaproteobacteria bacterium]|nr:PilN domain-containing protein [Candidatus Zymogenaceae bacterium]